MVEGRPGFGTDGVRGVANERLTAQLALELGMAAAHVLGKRVTDRHVVVGRDPRLSGDMLEAALNAGLAAMGCRVTNVGVIPTPGVSRLTIAVGATVGAVVSASHNPFFDNGIKFFAADGKKLSDTVELEIEEAMDAWQALPRPIGASIGRIEDRPELREDYRRSVVSTAVGRLEGLRIVVDCANGAASDIAPGVFADLGAEVDAIHCSPDGLNINADCGSTRPGALQDRVRETGAHVGLALDGDGDRVMMCDATGALVDGDRMMAICAMALRRRGLLAGNAVVATVMSNAGLDAALEPFGVRVLRTDVGDRYVAEEMDRSGAVVGGEQSGHLLLPLATPTGDGIVTALQVLGEMQRQGRQLASLEPHWETYPQRLRSIRVQRRGDWATSPAVQAAISDARQRLGRPEWLSVRASGTEPVIRVMAQDRDAGTVDQVVDSLCWCITDACGEA